MIRIRNIRIPASENPDLTKVAAKLMKIPLASVRRLVIHHRSIDARRKNNITFVYAIDIDIDLPEGQVLSRLRGIDCLQIQPQVRELLAPGMLPLAYPPVIVGAGPAGLLAAYTLARYGYHPVLLERGRDVDTRTADVASFWQTGRLDVLSNVQFGEGGAGTFSDGKLTTRVNDPRIGEILELLVAAGAPEEIKYVHKPHIGTDLLRTVVKNIRAEIIKLGGEVQFESQVTDLELSERQIVGLVVNHNRRIPSSVVLLGIGHSARDTYQMLVERRVAMEAKAFAVGVRIEHPQELIDVAQYGPLAGHPNLGPADYALVFHDKTTGRTAYSFCMCPGGLVVASASEPERLVTNGMSLFARNTGIANSALVVNVLPSDCGNNVLSGIEFQRRYEHAAYLAGGASFAAPAQTVGDFLSDRFGSADWLVAPSYRPAIRLANLRDCLPDFVADTLAAALPDFGRKVSGFDHPGAVMTGVETRTSAPVRILRDDFFTSVNTEGLYPIGEGAGYAGGIMSAALDGMNAAASIISKYRQI